MARKANPSDKTARKTPVRRTSVPKSSTTRKSSSAAVVVDEQMIARRAYEMYCSGVPGSQDDHWFAAERELRGGA